MEIKAKTLVIWLVLLIIGVAIIGDPVVARNGKMSSSPQIKNMDSGISIKTKITGENKDKIDKPDKDKKDAQDDPIKIKSHPVLKSPQSTAITTQTIGTIIARGQRWGPENK